VDVINAVGKITASLVRTFFEEGLTGSVVNSTTIDLPFKALESTDHAEDQLIIRAGPNAGYHRIVSVTRGTTDRVVVAGDTPFNVVEANQSWQVYREHLALTSKSVALSSELVIGAGSANTILGLVAGSVMATTSGFRVAESGIDVDFSHYDVVEGDQVKITAGSPPAITTHQVVELSSDNKQLELSPVLPVDVVVSAFQIYSAAAVAYRAFAANMVAWEAAREASEFDTDILELQRVMNPLLANTNPSIQQRTDAAAHAQDLYDLLDQLYGFLVAFEVDSVDRIDAALKMLKERGMDRAYDLLMKGKIASFFGMDKDDASSSSFMLKSMRSVAQKDLPLSRLEDGAADDYLISSAKETSADLDYSDQDKDENIRILGETPDFDNPDDEAATKRLRY
jgi:hypothetical protein